MPPSPAMRISPGRELKAENHRRGRSLESGGLSHEKDDDLALFNEVQNKERDNFLLQSNDDFDDIFSTKLRHFSDYKLGISIPARGESSDLLNAEGDKNDYDWLITPPETPLFRSLDDEAMSVSLAPRGRPRSQPVTFSRSSTMEKSYRSSRGSASPQRLSPSPKSGNSMSQSRGRPFSATHASPPPTLRHASPPPSKPTPPPRSGTPTPRRMSTGSAGATVPSRVRGASPIKASRGNSASPKIRAWQSNIPGFSSEAPPNLRTSLADRPASYVRGSSPASRNGSRSGRQSMSPTASRSVSSSHSHERDQFSSYSKGSVASSGDDDVDSLQSHPVSSSARSVPRSIGTPPNSRTMGFSKKPTKTLSNSAPKRSFDMALRQMEKKGPQNMFRPLLSSVPSSTFYVRKANVHHRAVASRNSLITTSSNASSDQGTSGALDTEESERNQEELTGDFANRQYQNVYDEVFVMDPADASNENVDSRIIEEPPGCLDGQDDEPSEIVSKLGADSSSQLDTTTAMDSADVVLDGNYDYSDADGTTDLEVCSRCSRTFHSVELVRERDLWFCLECRGMDVNSMTVVPVETMMVDKDNKGDFVHIKDCGPLEVLDRSVLIPELPLTTANDGQHTFSEASRDLASTLIENRELLLSTQQENFQSVDGDTHHQQTETSGDASEGTGISLLLQSSNSRKGHFVQSRSFTASSFSYNDFSYTRDSVNTMRSSIGHSTTSVSSSVDLGSSMQIQMRIHQQSSGGKYDMENCRYETPTKHKRSISSLSGASGHVSQVPSITRSCLGDSIEVISSDKDKDKEFSGVIHPDSPEQSLSSECTEAESTCTDVAELSSHLMNVNSGDTPAVSILPSEEPASHESGENLIERSNDSVNDETSDTHLQTSAQGDDAVESSLPDTVDVVEVPQPSALNYVSEIEMENADIVSSDLKSDADSSNSKTFLNELLEPSVSEAYNDFMVTAVEESDVSVPVILEESTIVLEDLSGTKPRSLTLEEATNAILFCSSIVHNLAYEAANIAINKENSSPESLRPAVTFVAKPNSDRRDVRSRTLGKRSSKSQKARQKKMEVNAKPPPVTDEIDEKPTPRIVKSPSKADSMHPPKLESKCNCAIM